MNLLTTRLESLRDQEIVVIMADNRAFRGTLTDFDAETIILRNVVEALPTSSASWEEPTLSTGIAHKVVTWQGTFSHDDPRARVVKLKDAMIRVAHVLRVWEYSTANMADAEHMEHAEVDEHHVGERVRRAA